MLPSPRQRDPAQVQQGPELRFRVRETCKSVVSLPAHIGKLRRLRDLMCRARSLSQPFRALRVHQRIVVCVAPDREVGGEQAILQGFFRDRSMLPVMRKFGEVRLQGGLVSPLDRLSDGAMQSAALGIAQEVIACASSMMAWRKA